MAIHATNTAMGLWPRTGWTSQPKPRVKKIKVRATWWSDMAVWFPDEGAGSWEFTAKTSQTSLRTSCGLTGYGIEVPLANFVDIPKGS